MTNPGDVSGLAQLVEDGTVDPTKIVATIGKSEGNGGANDFTRAFATTSYATYLGSLLHEAPDDVAKRIAFVWSGGCEGVLSPHLTVFTRDDQAPSGSPTESRLAVSVQRTRDFQPEEVGRMAEVTEVADAVKKAIQELGCSPQDVHYVQVKGPLLTPAAITDAASRGAEVVTTDPNGSKAYARGATALGVALGLSEVDDSKVDDSVIAKDMTLFSNVASTSAGGELTSCEIVLFANSPQSSSEFRIGHGELTDAIDIAGVRTMLKDAGLNFDCDPSDQDRDRIAAVFAKAEAPVGGLLRGQRTTMLSDADINYERHARAAVGAVIASLTGDSRIFVSGGTEHQTAPGHAPISAVVRV